MKQTRWNILIVDDEENDRFFLSSALRKVRPDLVINEAADGDEAIRYLNGEGGFSDRARYPFPTFIFIDLKMPKVDGLHVLGHLKDNPQWAIIPTIVFTSSADEDDVKKAFLCGACAYHLKPSDNHARNALCRKLMDYWATSEIPQVNERGEQLRTDSRGKLGERIAQP